MKRLIPAFAISILALLVALNSPRPAEAEVFRQMTRVIALAAPGANTDVTGLEYTWTGADGEICRIIVQCETSTIVNFMLDGGTTEIDLGLNSNTALVAGAAYVFDVPVQPGDVLTLQSETDTVWDFASLGAVQ